jgi:serine/threonine protein kinase
MRNHELEACLPRRWAVVAEHTRTPDAAELDVSTPDGPRRVHAARCGRASGVDARLLERSLEGLTRLRAENLVPLREVHRKKEWVFAASVVPRQVSLATWLERENHLQFLETGLVLRHLAHGLVLAHLAGVTHGALEPARLWWDVPILRIEGMGLSPAVAAASGFGRCAPRQGPYAAPELAARRPGCDPCAVDVYAFGVIAYQVLTGALPSPEEPSPARRREHIPPGLARLVVRCLAPKPAARATMSEALTLMEHLVTPPPGYEAGHLVNQARFLARNGQRDAARERLQRAAELAPRDAAVQDEYARFCREGAH